MDSCADDLVDLMRAGDLRALDRFTRCYGDRLVAVARASCRLHDDAEDAVQDALVEASRSMGSYRGQGSPLAWLSTLVVRRCHRLGRGKRHTAVHVVEEVTCACDSPEVSAAHAELAARLADALAALPTVDRLAVMLAHEGHTGDAIAAELGLTAPAVRKRLSRARQRLRTDLADLG